MCIQVVRKVVKIVGDIAILDDNRCVRLGMVNDVHVGDLVEVYGDIALGKVQETSKENL